MVEARSPSVPWQRPAPLSLTRWFLETANRSEAFFTAVETMLAVCHVFFSTIWTAIESVSPGWHSTCVSLKHMFLLLCLEWLCHRFDYA